MKNEISMEYLQYRLNLVGFTYRGSSSMKAFGRLLEICQTFDFNDGQLLWNSWDALPSQVKAIIIDEFTNSKNIVIEPDHMEQVLKSCLKSDLTHGIEKALMVLGSVLFKTRHFLNHNTIESDKAIIDLKTVADLIEQSGVEAIDQNEILIVEQDDELKLELVKRSYVDVASYQSSDISEFLSGVRTAFIGIGGGSDCLQASQLAFVSGAIPACVISVRESDPLDPRTVGDHGGEIYPNVFKILSKSIGTRRFLEYLPANKIPVFLVLDERKRRFTNNAKA